MPYGTVNADVIQTSTSGGILGAGNASIMKNRIINGAMVIDQRNAGASVTASASTTYTLDRWCYSATQASKFTVQQNAGSVTAPVGFKNYLGATSSSAYTVGASEVFLIRQFIEGYNVSDLGWGTANAKTVTLSFQVYSSLTGTFGGSIQNAAENRSYPFSYTISSANTWTTASVTIAGDTTGTWQTTTNTGMAINFSIGSGSSVSGTAGAWVAGGYTSVTGATSVVGTNGATFYITGVQLEVGSSATGFEYVNYQTSLTNCQRYFFIVARDDAGPIGIANCTATTGIRFPVPFPVNMRTDSTVVYTAGQIRLNSSGANVNSTATPYLGYISTRMADVNLDGFTGLSAGQAGSIRLFSTTGYLAFNAEL